MIVVAQRSSQQPWQSKGSLKIMISPYSFVIFVI